jgi:hypothetical protein
MLEIAMSQEQRVDFLTNAGSCAVLGNAIRKLDASRATATRPADIAMIFGMIEKMGRWCRKIECNGEGESDSMGDERTCNRDG